ALAYDNYLDRKMDCVTRYPGVPTTGVSGHAAGTDSCRPVPFPDVKENGEIRMERLPRETQEFLGLDEKNQLELLNTRAGKMYGMCDYYSRSFSSVFAGTTLCSSTRTSADEKSSLAR